MSEDLPDWVRLAEQSRSAWESLSVSEMEELLSEFPCRACSDCNKPAGHTEPHTCDCASRWQT